MPTIRGPVKVSFENNHAESFVLEVEIPANTTARVALPCMNDGKPVVLLDAKPVEAELEGNFVVVDPVGSGKHILERR